MYIIEAVFCLHFKIMQTEKKTNFSLEIYSPSIKLRNVADG